MAAKTAPLVPRRQSFYRFEDELKCPACTKLYVRPVLLSCAHSVCYDCIPRLQTPVSMLGSCNDDHASSSASDISDNGESDKISYISDSDSGVVSNGNNSPISNSSLSSSIHCQETFTISCPSCSQLTYMDNKSADGLIRNKVLENILNRTVNNKPSAIKCQLCEGAHIAEATVVCEQCEVYYCNSCRERCHPIRGPLAKHSLVPAGEGQKVLQARGKERTVEAKCSRHVDESISMHCVACRISACCICVRSQHAGHDVQPLGATVKTHKMELSHHLQLLSEKAKIGSEFIQQLKDVSEKIKCNSMEFEALVVAQCDALMEALQSRKSQLLSEITSEKQRREKILTDQQTVTSAILQQTAALLQFSVEVLREQDSVAFLQVSPSLIQRISTANESIFQKLTLKPLVTPEFEMTLYQQPLWKAIDSLSLYETTVPVAPVLVSNNCFVDNSRLSVTWLPDPRGVCDGYALELDNGSGFTEVYSGLETTCSVDGLHFGASYKARVKAFNSVGDVSYSDVVSFTIPKAAAFTFDAKTTVSPLCLSRGNMTVTSTSVDNHIVLGNVALSQGIHYWEIVIDRIENNPDPAFGIARFDVPKAMMLGKDDKSWCMYIDSRRSWFMHRGVHASRTSGGIVVGTVIGVLLDLERHTLSFYINKEPHGPIAFHGLCGVFYPAISLNQSVQVTLRTGLQPPNK